jgi:hypothetical protein
MAAIRLDRLRVHRNEFVHQGKDTYSAEACVERARQFVEALTQGLGVDALLLNE